MNVYNSIEDLSSQNEPFVELESESDKDNDKLDAIIESMNLNQGQIDMLNCYMAGIAFVEIARFLGVNNATVWRHRKQLQQKYYENVL